MNPEWQITCWYLVTLTIIVIFAKALSVFVEGRRGNAMDGSFIFAPSLCLCSWIHRSTVVGNMTIQTWLPCLGTLSALSLCYLLYIPMVRIQPWPLQSYCAIVPFWLLVESIAQLCKLLWLPTGYLVPVVNSKPWAARSVADFWGNRWNRLFGNWLRRIVFYPLRRQPQRALASTFLVSGLLHELLVALPMQLVFGEPVWGLMTAYFMIQYLAIAAERRLPLQRWQSRRLFLWMAVIGPAPLVLNQATLRIFHLV